MHPVRFCGRVLKEATVRGLPSASLDESRTWNRTTPGSILPGPASLADEDLAPRKEGDCPAPPGNRVRRQPEVTLDGQLPERVSLFTRVALQVDLEELRFSGGARDFTSVIATLQTMLHDAGYAFLNLVPTWGRTLSPELLAAQDGQFMSDASFLWGLLTLEQVAWNEIAQGRQYSVRRDDAPFQTLDPEVTSAFRFEDDGDTLMLTPEEQELLGVAMVTRLRPAHNRSDARGSTDAPLSVPSWPGSDEDTRVWGGPIPEVVGTSSLASGDAPMLTPDESMSSAGGGSQGSPGSKPSTAMVGVYMATTGTPAGQAYTTEQPTLYVPVAEYPPGQGTRPPPPSLQVRLRRDGLGGSEEETISDVPMTIRGPHLPENSRDLQAAYRQISELCAALAARDELERIRNEEYRVARTAQAAQAKLSQEALEHQEAELQERVAREMEWRKVSDQDFASLQAKVYLLEKERAQEREEGTQFRAEAERRMEGVTEKCGQAVSKAKAVIDETKLQADEELSRIRREMEHQARESRAREAREVELQEAQLEELRIYREQTAVGRSRRQPREPFEREWSGER
ncbi:LOW QUALITY PROTEIN: hypothetical protein PHMEG_00022944 [Phytophthora megakarya]|uniref:Uncharacterized protein n=1 Tax=Phytophthora megakarya TaxID=4795 RepID=A0A225VI07_9STRA|nr:LOW QUALITY PROTEIN: hypothetical protein PHMEG_00022944 [Phytophthora megakarya]